MGDGNNEWKSMVPQSQIHAKFPTEFIGKKINFSAAKDQFERSVATAPRISLSITPVCCIIHFFLFVCFIIYENDF